MSIYFAKLEQVKEDLEDAVALLDSTHGGQKYTDRLYQVLEEIEQELETAGE